MLRRRDLLLVVIAAVALSSVTTWVAAVRIRSPAEEAARTASPTPSPILSPVIEQVLTTRVVTRGTAHYRSPQELIMARSGLKSGPGVVTSLPAIGSEVAAGEVLLTISGRPVLVLVGEQPSHRDLGPGVSGQDVLQLEAGLASLGYDPGGVDGTYDEDTGRAVSSLYEHHGVPPVVASEDQLAQARPREAELVPGTRASAGVQVPADEVAFVSSTPVRVTDLLVGLAATAEGPLVTVTGSEVVVDGLVPVEQASLIRTGAEVELDEPALGIEAAGTVSWVADRPGTNEADGFHVAFEVAVEGPPPTLVGASVRLTIPIDTTGDAMLTVPLSAVSLGPDGGSRVERLNGPDSFEVIGVTTGLSADGYVSVTPEGAELSPGDMVLIGLDPRATGGG